MRKFSILALILCLILSTVPSVSASTLDGLTITDQAYYIDGSFHQIAMDADGVSWYYVDGVLQKARYMVFVNGHYYVCRSSGALATESYTFNSTGLNGYLPSIVDGSAYYTFDFDSYGRLVDPPEYPENWQAEWSSTWPFPTEPAETEPPTEAAPPDTVDPPDPDEVVAVVNTALVGATDIWTNLVEATGMWSYYFAAILGLLLLRFLLVPIFGRQVSFGAGQSDTAVQSRRRDSSDIPYIPPAGYLED